MYFSGLIQICTKYMLDLTMGILFSAYPSVINSAFSKSKSLGTLLSLNQCVAYPRCLNAFTQPP